jgi:magnesium-transporting ATPase (P-type)
MDESSLTGEIETLSKDIYEKCVEYIKNKKGKKSPSPLILSGTNCVEGTGSAIVIAVGIIVQKVLLEERLIMLKKIIKLHLRKN